MSTASAFQTGSDEAEIRGLIVAWQRALEAKDSAALTAHYAADVVTFDVKPPYITRGVEAYRKLWDDCFPYLPEGFTSEHHDLIIAVASTMAFVYGLHRFVTKQAHPASQSWIRFTTCYEKRNGRWLVTHEHASIPFDPVEEKVAYITNDAVMNS